MGKQYLDKILNILKYYYFSLFSAEKETSKNEAFYPIIRKVTDLM